MEEKLLAVGDVTMSPSDVTCEGARSSFAALEIARRLPYLFLPPLLISHPSFLTHRLLSFPPPRVCPLRLLSTTFSPLTGQYSGSLSPHPSFSSLPHSLSLFPKSCSRRWGGGRRGNGTWEDGGGDSAPKLFARLICRGTGLHCAAYCTQ